MDERFSIEKLEIEELEKELQIRKEALRKKNKPQELAEKDWSQVIEYCQRIIDDLHENGYSDEDLNYYIYEAAMTAVFGGEVWPWVRKQRG